MEEEEKEEVGGGGGGALTPQTPQLAASSLMTATLTQLRAES